MIENRRSFFAKVIGAIAALGFLPSVTNANVDDGYTPGVTRWIYLGDDKWDIEQIRMSEIRPGDVFYTYRKIDGEWQPTKNATAKSMPYVAAGKWMVLVEFEE